MRAHETWPHMVKYVSFVNSDAFHFKLEPLSKFLCKVGHSIICPSNAHIFYLFEGFGIFLCETQVIQKILLHDIEIFIFGNDQRFFGPEAE